MANALRIRDEELQAAGRGSCGQEGVVRQTWVVTVMVLAVGLVLPFVGGVAARQGDTVAAVKQQFAGNYELVSFRSFGPNGEISDNPYVARIMYDELGNMAANGMPRDLPDRSPDADGRRQRGGFAYFGTFDVNVNQGYVVHQVVGSPMAPQWVGQGLVRYYEFSENLLRLSLKNDEGRITGTLTWRRLE